MCADMADLKAAIVASKSEINDANPIEQQDVSLVVVKKGENEIAQIDAVPKGTPSTHINVEGEQNPLNECERKVYDREFLIKLQDIPSSRIKPTNLPDLDVVTASPCSVSCCYYNCLGISL